MTVTQTPGAGKQLGGPSYASPVATPGASSGSAPPGSMSTAYSGAAPAPVGKFCNLKVQRVNLQRRHVTFHISLSANALKRMCYLPAYLLLLATIHRLPHLP